MTAVRKFVFPVVVVMAVIFTIPVVAAETITVTRSDRGKSVTLQPRIHWPSGSGPFGVVVVVNSSSGARDIFLNATIKPMNDAGIAVAILDTFTPRGISSTATD